MAASLKSKDVAGTAGGEQQPQAESVKTFDLQKDLPCLPVPEPEVTLQFFMSLVKPLARGEGEVIESRRKVEDLLNFYKNDSQAMTKEEAENLEASLLPVDSTSKAKLKQHSSSSSGAAITSSGIDFSKWTPQMIQRGEVLLNALKHRAKMTFEDSSWLHQWWHEMYIGIREPLPFNSNYYFVLDDSATTTTTIVPQKGGDQGLVSLKTTIRAAGLINAAAKFKLLLDKEAISPDKEGRTVNLCMIQYKNLFCATKIPQPGHDDYIIEEEWKKINALKEEEATGKARGQRDANDVEGVSEETGMKGMLGRYITVICNNLFYGLEVIRPESGEDKNNACDEEELVPVDPLLIKEALGEIMRHSFYARGKQNASNGEDGVPPVGLFTADWRDKWHSNRAALCSLDIKNEHSLQFIDQSLFVCCLDVNTSPETLEEISSCSLQGKVKDESVPKGGSSTSVCNGDMGNRWYDKLQLIVFANGRASFNIEHTGLDGTTSLHLASYMYTSSSLCEPSLFSSANIEDLSVAKKVASLWKPLPFVLEDKSKGVSLRKEIESSYTEVLKNINGLANRVLEFKNFGKTFIVSHKVSPDAFMQIAFQLTHFRLFGHSVGTYESASTKRFLYGRTAVLRVSTEASNEFAKECGALMKEKGKLEEGSVEKAEGIEERKHRFFTLNDKKYLKCTRLLRDAATEHVKNMKKCKSGYDVDRVLYGMKMIANEAIAYFKSTNTDESSLRLPEFFYDALYQRLCNSILSTSNCGGGGIRLFGFCPVAANGYGLGYSIDKENISVSVSSYVRDPVTGNIYSANEFVTELEKSLLFMQEIFSRTSRPSFFVRDIPVASSRGSVAAARRESVGEHEHFSSTSKWVDVDLDVSLFGSIVSLVQEATKPQYTAAMRDADKAEMVMKQGVKPSEVDQLGAHKFGSKTGDEVAQAAAPSNFTNVFLGDCDVVLQHDPTNYVPAKSDLSDWLEDTKLEDDLNLSKAPEMRYSDQELAERERNRDANFFVGLVRKRSNSFMSIPAKEDVDSWMIRGVDFS
eukprot:Nk52_evm29s266 gene=Nk52_evmTU29s266